MLKTLITLFRGAATERTEAVADLHAIPLLQQQIRDAAAALRNAKQSLAYAMADLAAKERGVEDLERSIARLTGNARKALSDGREDLALKAATAIAEYEDRRAERVADLDRYGAEVETLKSGIAAQMARLEELNSGLQAARAAEALRRVGGPRHRSATSALDEAEATLARIRSRHASDDDTARAMAELEQIGKDGGAERELAEAGYGGKPRTDPAAVLARLRAPLAIEAQ